MNSVLSHGLSANIEAYFIWLVLVITCGKIKKTKDQMSRSGFITNGLSRADVVQICCVWWSNKTRKEVCALHNWNILSRISYPFS